MQVSLKSDKNNSYFTWKPIYVFFIISWSFLLRMSNISDRSCRENQKHISSSINLFWKSCHLWDNVGKYGRARDPTDNTTHAHCTLHNKATNTLQICNTSCFSMPPVIMWMHLNVMFVCTLPFLFHCQKQ